MMYSDELVVDGHSWDWITGRHHERWDALQLVVWAAFQMQMAELDKVNREWADYWICGLPSGAMFDVMSWLRYVPWPPIQMAWPRNPFLGGYVDPIADSSPWMRAPAPFKPFPMSPPGGFTTAELRDAVDEDIRSRIASWLHFDVSPYRKQHADDVSKLLADADLRIFFDRDGDSKPAQQTGDEMRPGPHHPG